MAVFEREPTFVGPAVSPYKERLLVNSLHQTGVFMSFVDDCFVYTASTRVVVDIIGRARIYINN